MWFKGDFIKSLKSKNYKVNEFLRGLLGDPNASVNDRWMYRVFFGDSKLSEAIVKSNKIKDADSHFLIAENTAARQLEIDLAKALTKRTGRKWSNREVQAALWVHKRSSETGGDISTAVDYGKSLKTKMAKYGGKTPLEVLKKYTDGLPKNALAHKLGIDPIEFGKVSALEKKRLEKLATLPEHQVRKVTGDDDLRSFIGQLKNNRYAHVLTIPTLKELKDQVKDGAQVYLTKDGLAGYVLHKDNLQKLFNNSGRTGVGTNLIVHGIAQGGRTQDCFDGHLPEFYGETFGFKEYNRVPFDEKYAPKPWPRSSKGEIEHKPDIIFMRLEPEQLKIYGEKNGKVTEKNVRDRLGNFKDDWERISPTQPLRKKGGPKGVSKDARPAGKKLDAKKQRVRDKKSERAKDVLNTKFSRKLNSKQKLWLKGSKVKKILYHGTFAPDIDVFNVDEGNLEGWMGGGTYLTDSPLDAYQNYANLEGPDIQIKTERVREESSNIAEDNAELFGTILEDYIRNHPDNGKARISDIESVDLEDIPDALENNLSGSSYDVLIDAALDYYVNKVITHGGNGGALYPVIVKMQNPLYLDETIGKTTFTLNEEFDEDSEEYTGVSGTLVDFVDEIRETIEAYSGGYHHEETLSELISEIYAEAIDNGGEITAEQIFFILKNSDATLDLMDDETGPRLSALMA